MHIAAVCYKAGVLSLYIGRAEKPADDLET